MGAGNIRAPPGIAEKKSAGAVAVDSLLARLADFRYTLGT
jgi:hypothetical protein